MSAEAAIDRLLQIHPKGFDLSLDRIGLLLEKLGNPHLRIPPAFHVAGTNGKGSTTAFLRAILEAAGRSVHVHTSPHLVNWNERYRLGMPGGGKLVDDKKLEDAILRAERANGGKPITVFEIMSAVAFMLFAEEPADYCVMEVGLGGRFDATNVLVNPAACLITPIGLDHQAYLGDTIEKIAFEKAGIIKPGAPVFVADQPDSVLNVIRTVAEERNCRITIARQDYDYFEQAGRFLYQDESGLLDLPMPSLAGNHQLANAALAITALRDRIPELSAEAIETGLCNTVWPGRFERLRPGKITGALPSKSAAGLDIWIDGGHNPQAAGIVATELAALDERAPMPVVMIAGMLTTKDAAGFFATFQGLVSSVWTVPVNDSDSGFAPDALSELVESNGIPSTPAESVHQALTEIASRYAGTGMVRVLICGSLYLVGEVLRENATPPK
jgi:dihydrofolate synthase/folylpolyglutamate synthase